MILIELCSFFFPINSAEAYFCFFLGEIALWIPAVSLWNGPTDGLREVLRMMSKQTDGRTPVVSPILTVMPILWLFLRVQLEQFATLVISVPGICAAYKIYLNHYRTCWIEMYVIAFLPKGRSDMEIMTGSSVTARSPPGVEPTIYVFIAGFLSLRLRCYMDSIFITTATGLCIVYVLSLLEVYLMKEILYTVVGISTYDPALILFGLFHSRGLERLPEEAIPAGPVARTAGPVVRTAGPVVRTAGQAGKKGPRYRQRAVNTTYTM